jgi:perosamine synthetase
MYIPAWPTLSPTYFLRTGNPARLPFPLDRSTNSYFYVARNGIYHLTRSLSLERGDVVLAPDYHHGNEIYALRAAGANIRYYPVRKNLQVDLNVLSDLCRLRPRVLYLTHYLGWPQPMSEILSLCRHFGITLIEDCALAFLSDMDGEPLGSFGDYSVFCLYKTVPVPNGGVLVKNSASPPALNELALRQADAMSVFGQSVELMLHWLRMHSETCGRVSLGLKRRAGKLLSARAIGRFPVGGTGFDVSRTSTGMSEISHRLLRRFHYDSVKDRRRANYKILHSRLHGRVKLLDTELRSGLCPLFFPLLVSDKKAASHLLSREGIQTVEFWNNADPSLPSGQTEAQFLRTHLLEVPIHQNVSEDEVEFVAQRIIDLGIGMRA